MPPKKSKKTKKTEESEESEEIEETKIKKTKTEESEESEESKESEEIEETKTKETRTKTKKTEESEESEEIEETKTKTKKTKLNTLKEKKEFIREILDRRCVLPNEQQELKHIFVANYQVPTKEDKFDENELEFFFVSQKQDQGSFCLHIALKNGDISTMGMKNLYKNPKPPGQSLEPQRSAFRNEIRDQIETFVQEEGGPTKGMEADHSPPFCVLRDQFLLSMGEDLHLKDVEVDHVGGLYLFRKKDFRKRWKEFHKKHAKLEYVPAGENWSRYLTYLSKKGHIESNQLESLKQLVILKK